MSPPRKCLSPGCNTLPALPGRAPRRRGCHPGSREPFLLARKPQPKTGRSTQSVPTLLFAIPFSGLPKLPPAWCPSLTTYLGQVSEHGLQEAWVALAGRHSAQLQAQEGVGGQAAQGLGQGGGAQEVVGQGQGLQALGICSEGQKACQPHTASSLSAAAEPWPRPSGQRPAMVHRAAGCRGAGSARSSASPPPRFWVLLYLPPLVTGRPWPPETDLDWNVHSGVGPSNAPPAAGAQPPVPAAALTALSPASELTPLGKPREDSFPASEYWVSWPQRACAGTTAGRQDTQS